MAGRWHMGKPDNAGPLNDCSITDEISAAVGAGRTGMPARAHGMDCLGYLGAILVELA